MVSAHYLQYTYILSLMMLMDDSEKRQAENRWLSILHLHLIIWPLLKVLEFPRTRNHIQNYQNVNACEPKISSCFLSLYTKTGLKKPYSRVRKQNSADADAMIFCYATPRFWLASIGGVEEENLFSLTTDANLGHTISIEVKTNKTV